MGRRNFFLEWSDFSKLDPDQACLFTYSFNQYRWCSHSRVVPAQPAISPGRPSRLWLLRCIELNVPPPPQSPSGNEAKPAERSKVRVDGLNREKGLSPRFHFLLPRRFLEEVFFTISLRKLDGAKDKVFASVRFGKRCWWGANWPLSGPRKCPDKRVNLLWGWGGGLFMFFILKV